MSKRPILAVTVLASLALLLGACNGLSSIPGPTAAASLPPADAPAPAAAAAAPAPQAALPEGKGCGPSIARTQAVVDSDVSTENLNAAVGKRFSADLAKAAEACSAGRETEGTRLLAAAKSRYGYR